MPATRNEANDQVNRAGNAGQHATEEAARTARAVTDEAAQYGGTDRSGWR